MSLPYAWNHIFFLHFLPVSTDFFSAIQAEMLWKYFSFKQKKETEK